MKGEYSLRKTLSTELSTEEDNLLSNWDEAIERAKKRIQEIKRSVRTFESLRDQGVKFPAEKATGKVRRTSGSTKGLLGQK